MWQITLMKYRNLISWTSCQPSRNRSCSSMETSIWSEERISSKMLWTLTLSLEATRLKSSNWPTYLSIATPSMDLFLKTNSFISWAGSIKRRNGTPNASAIVSKEKSGHKLQAWVLLSHTNLSQFLVIEFFVSEFPLPIKSILKSIKFQQMRGKRSCWQTSCATHLISLQDFLLSKSMTVSLCYLEAKSF